MTRLKTSELLLIKEAAKNTVKEAGDGTTTATVLAEALIKEVQKEQYAELSVRFIKQGINSALDKVNTYLNRYSYRCKR